MIPSLSEIQTVIKYGIAFLWSMSALIFMARMFLNGFSYYFTQGDSKKLEELKKKIWNTILGFVLVFMSWVLVSVLIIAVGLKDPEVCFKDGTSALDTVNNTIKFDFIFLTTCN